MVRASALRWSRPSSNSAGSPTAGCVCRSARAIVRVMHALRLHACHDCDLLQREVPLAPGGTARCPHSSTTLFGAVRQLYDDDMTSVAGLVFTTTILMPGLEIAALLYLLLPLKLGRVPRGLPAVFRIVHAVRPWGMVEVFLLGTLVALTKLAALASVVPGIALWSFGALMFLVAVAAASFDTHALWERVEEVR